jgi:hypothetical protein
MGKEKVFGIIRHVITFVGGVLVVKGLVEEAMVQEVLGGVLGLVGTIWSIVDKKK